MIIDVLILVKGFLYYLRPARRPCARVVTPGCPGAGDSYPGCRRRRSRLTPATTLRSRCRPAHATTRRKGRDERRAGLASAASNSIVGSSLAVPQGTRGSPQPHSAENHHTTSAGRPELLGRCAYLLAMAVSSVAPPAAAVARPPAWPAVRPVDLPALAGSVYSCAAAPPLVRCSAPQSAPAPADY